MGGKKPVEKDTSEQLSECTELVPTRDLCECADCKGALVQEYKSERSFATEGFWRTLLVCPDCERETPVFATDNEIKKFDEEQILGTVMLQLVEHFNDKIAKREDVALMMRQADRFKFALQKGHLLPEDF